MKRLCLFILLSAQVCYATIITKQDDSFQVNKKHFSIEALVKDYSKIKGYTLLLDSSLKGDMSIYGPKSFKENELDLFVSSVLNQMNYTILITENIKQLEVISARDIRYRGGEVITDINKVPMDYYFYQYVMRLKYVNANEVSRNLRPFVSRYGRVIDEKNANTIILADTGINIHRLQKLLTILDTPEFLKRKKIVDRVNSKIKEEVVIEKSIFKFFKDEYVLFLICFSLIGAILGFGVRGYMMKKIEGGW